MSVTHDTLPAGKVRKSHLQSLVHEFAGGALGSLLYRDTGASDGANWLADVAAGSVLVSGGVGAAPAFSDTPTLARVNFPSLTAGSIPFRVTPEEAAANKFQLHVSGTLFGGDTRLDQVASLGWNVDSAGNRIDGTDTAVSINFESHYAPDANRYVEWQCRYYSAAGVEYRPFNWVAHKTTNFVDVALCGDRVQVTNALQTNQAFIFSADGSTGTLLVNPGSVVSLNQNNVTQLKQINLAGDAYIELPYIGNANELRLGGGLVTDIRWMKALVALGGGAAPTLGTIGGTGPGTATQNSWLRFMDATGAICFLPVWK